MGTAKPDKKQYVVNSLFYGLVLMMAVGLKLHYSRAGFEELAWILAPTAMLTEVITGDIYEPEENCGFVNRERGIIIAPSCAGVNFLIISFCISVLPFVHMPAGTKTKFGRICICGVASYGLTIVVNTIRIAISAMMLDTDICSGQITYERMHRFEGVVIYFLFLYLFHAAVRRIILGKNTETCRCLSEVIPLVGYLAVAVGIPTMNVAFRKQPTLFAEHCVVVITASVGLCLILIVARTSLKKFVCAASLMDKARNIFFASPRAKPAESPAPCERSDSGDRYQGGPACHRRT